MSSDEDVSSLPDLSVPGSASLDIDPLEEDVDDITHLSGLYDQSQGMGIDPELFVSSGRWA